VPGERPIRGAIDEASWRTIKVDLDLYKFYLGIVIRFAAFVFGITGAIVSFICVNADKPWMLGALSVPILLNLGAAVILLRGIGPAEILNADHQNTCAKVKLTPAYDLTALPRTLFALGWTNVFVAVGLTLLAVLVYQHTPAYFPTPSPDHADHAGGPGS
jgi:hypothetical protein